VPPQTKPLAKAAETVNVGKEAPLPVPVNAVQNNGKAEDSGVMSIAFEPNKSALDGAALQALSELAKGLASDKRKTASINLLTRETENLPSAQRRQLAQERAKVASDALVANGVQSSRVAIEWLPDASSAIQRHGAGMQVVARLKVTEAKAGSGW
jgi:outer membrane protein OmpA-like peptidoglycan-associated protein